VSPSLPRREAQMKTIYHIPADKFKEIINYWVDEYINSEGSDTPTGGTIIVDVDQNLQVGEATHTIKIGSFHNLVEHLRYTIEDNYTPEA
jgi:hypothetical protein